MIPADSKCRVGVVILNWNKPDDTILCAQSVLSEFDRQSDLLNGIVVVVENGSDQNSRAKMESWIKQTFDQRVSLICNELNLGFSAGMNTGIKFLNRVHPNYLWLLNNDLTIAPGALMELHNLAESDKSTCIFGPTVLGADSGEVQCAGGCRYLPWLGLERPIQAGKPISQLDQSHQERMDYIYGAAMFLRGDFLESIGGLDERYFLFYEELELALTLKPNQNMAWCPSAIVYHGGSKSKAATKESRAFTAYHAALSALKFTRRYYPWCLPTVTMVRIIGLGIVGIYRGNLLLVAAPWKALWSWLRDSPH